MDAERSDPEDNRIDTMPRMSQREYVEWIVKRVRSEHALELLEKAKAEKRKAQAITARGSKGRAVSTGGKVSRTGKGASQRLGKVDLVLRPALVRFESAPREEESVAV